MALIASFSRAEADVTPGPDEAVPDDDFPAGAE
jgi:hypothetical protein